jgi:putative transposase
MRLLGHDYGEAGYYFLTTATEGRACLFGTVINDHFASRPSGQMVIDEWLRISDQFPGVSMDEYCVMPNHFHAIVGIGIHEPSDASIPRIMQAFKSKTTVRYGSGVRDDRWTPFRQRLWQPGYYDHIVRNDKDLDRIRDYIAANPSSWNQDRLYSPE